MVRLNDSYEYEFYFGASPTTKAQAAELRKNMTIAEKVLWQQLRNCQIDGLKFRRQHPVDIFILDFYCHERKLAVEVDGGIHNEAAQKEWDENRTYELNEFGIKVLRFTNEDIIDRTRDVIKTIKECLKL
jgi:very-short-patch-repair endonuclease